MLRGRLMLTELHCVSRRTNMYSSAERRRRFDPSKLDSCYEQRRTRWTKVLLRLARIPAERTTFKPSHKDMSASTILFIRHKTQCVRTASEIRCRKAPLVLCYFTRPSMLHRIFSFLERNQASWRSPTRHISFNPPPPPKSNQTGAASN